MVRSRCPNACSPSASAIKHSQQLQMHVDRGGGHSVVYTPHYKTGDGRELALARCCYQTRVHETCTCTNCWTSAGLAAVRCSRFPGNLAVFIPGNSGMKKSGNPGRPGNGRPGMKTLIRSKHLIRQPRPGYRLHFQLKFN